MKLSLSIKTDQPLAELGLYENNKRIDYLKWTANLMLAETIHQKINELLKRNNCHLNEIGRIIFYKGPGSFTGLRIGASVANSLGWALKADIIGSNGSKWVEQALQIEVSSKLSFVVPEYGEPAKTTKPRGSG